jgi:hypothetical protein
VTTDESQRPAADTLLERVLALLAPAVRLLLAHGVTYQRLAAALKRLYVDEGSAELQRLGKRQTDSALTLLTGLQRRDVAALNRPDAVRSAPRSHRVSTVQQVALRWLALPRYRDAAGRPRDLPFRAALPDEASFVELAQSVSKDVPAASVAEELVRLGLAEFDGTTVRRRAETAAPITFEQQTQFLSDNVRDHLAAAAANVQGRQPHFLEYSLFSDELRPNSVEELNVLFKVLSRELLRQARQSVVEITDRDRALGFADAPEMRMRFGVYYYAEPMAKAAAADNAADNAADAVRAADAARTAGPNHPTTAPAAPGGHGSQT